MWGRCNERGWDTGPPYVPLWMVEEGPSIHILTAGGGEADCRDGMLAWPTARSLAPGRDIDDCCGCHAGCAAWVTGGGPPM